MNDKTDLHMTHSKNSHARLSIQKNFLAFACLIAGMGASTAHADPAVPVAGHSVVGVTVEELTQVVSGWSAKKSILGKKVYNEKGEKIGKALDLIVTPDKSISYIIIGAGGFIGIDRHDVAIPVSQVHEKAGKLTIDGATKAAVEAMPEFKYGT